MEEDIEKNSILKQQPLNAGFKNDDEYKEVAFRDFEKQDTLNENYNREESYQNAPIANNYTNNYSNNSSNSNNRGFFGTLYNDPDSPCNNCTLIALTVICMIIVIGVLATIFTKG